MTDLELERRFADAEHNIDRLYAHVLMLSGILLVAALVFVSMLLWRVL